MPTSVPQKRSRNGSGSRASSLPIEALATIARQSREAYDDIQCGGNPSSADVSISITDAGIEGSHKVSRDQVIRPPKTSLPEVRREIFGDSEEIISQVKDEVLRARNLGQKLHLGGLPNTLIAVPDLLRLPVPLRPWEGMLAKWTTVNEGSRKHPLYQDHILRLSDQISIRGPMLPSDYWPWFLSVSIDPGEEQTGRGHTTLLFVGAPKGWEPGPRETLRGPYGEHFHVRLDALVMRVPPDWWPLWAYGALEAGALYFVAPLPDEIEE